MANATKASSLQYWSCGHCGVECSRVRVRGQRPKWCSQRCADLGKKGRAGTCQRCGVEYFGFGDKYCSIRCAGPVRGGRSTDLVHVGPSPVAVAPPAPVTVVTLPKWWGVITSGPCAWCGETFAAMSGAASEHDCVDCGGSAYQWSYDHSDPDERVATEPPLTGIAYSLNPEHYSPRCVPCHKRFDLGRLDAVRGGTTRW